MGNLYDIMFCVQVCRYTNNPDDEPKCGACGKSGDLWACLVCGCVGCGRYAAGCSLDHWRESGHCYALELTTQRVWDYVRDGWEFILIFVWAIALTTSCFLFAGLCTG